jgi:Ca2+-binding EF-hand superfamily protein
MKRPAPLLLGIMVILPWLVIEGEQPESPEEPTPPPLAKDVQDLVFLGETRPFLIRLHVRIDGKPFREVWDDYMHSLFQYLDRDGDGVLSQKELEPAPKPAFLLQLLQGNLMSMNPGMAMDSARRSPEMEVRLVGGKATQEGLTRYYRLSGIEPFLALTQDRSEQADKLTDALFKHLDVDGDGKLSKDELLAAASTLRKLDVDDDEMISAQEILPRTDNGPEMIAGDQVKTEPLSSSSTFLLVSADESSTRLANALLARYDKDKNEKLSRAEFAIDKALFDRLDANHDDQLDVQELAKFHVYHPVDIELVVHFGGSSGAAEYVDVYNPFEQGSPLAPAALTRDNKPLVMALDGSRLDLRASAGVPAGFQSVRQFIVEQFQSTDEDKKEFITEIQAQGNSYLQVLFPLARKEQDGRLSLAELTAYIDLVGRAMSSSTVLMITDHGRGMFDLLDTRHAGRLRQRDLNAAWARLAPWDKDGKGYITKTEVPHQFELQLSRGQPGGSLQIAEGVVIPVRGAEPRLAAATKGPLWFQRMDRNGDGYVSPREFLGTREDFQRIDTDGDGLISPEEAERADAWMRKQAPRAEAQSPPSMDKPGPGKRE